jgi:tetratricopeptide (TPR) repeat protein
MLKVSGLIGRRDFAAAIGALESYQISNPTDTACLNLLAQCHRWSGADDKAIEVAEKVLEVDPHYFPALKLLSEILAQGSDHERAAAYMRRGVESYPQEMSPLPYFLMQLARVTMRTLRPRRKMSAQEFEPWESINAENRAWFQCAKEYLAWIADKTGSKTLPVLH